jgi:bifunctional non-homologous end joining protein LigD
MAAPQTPGVIRQKKPASRTRHPSRQSASAGHAAASKFSALTIPRDRETVDVRLQDRAVTLTNLRKLFWPELGITKGDLLQYYADIAPFLLPHLQSRAMVMKRYPNGARGKFFFMKRAPVPRPQWIETCSIEHASKNIIDFPIVQDLLSLLWVINLGCIDLNQWYARCDDVDRPDYLHFDLDPVKGATFEQVLETSLVIRDALDHLEMPSFVKTTGSKGLHIYIPIVRGPNQKEVWTFAKALAQNLAAQRPKLITAEYRIEKRPSNHVLVDYNQNAWGRTLASVYSVRPAPKATVSTPITWKEVEAGTRIEDFRIDNVRERVKKIRDLWAPLVSRSKRVKLERFL